MSYFMRVGIFRIGVSRTDLGCKRLTVNGALSLFMQR